jgi:Fuc2NAc and GlcNAc transferase
MLIAVLAFVATLLLTGAYRQFAIKSCWLDHPNHRSSHAQATPRGAGVIFGVIILLLAAVLLTNSTLRHIFLLAVVVIAAGWWDDIRGLTLKIRFALYLLAATGVVIAISINCSPSALALSLALGLGLLWLINLYNFMDGINGIAGCEGIFVLLSALALIDGSHEIAELILCSSGAIAGFLLWNFPAGKVFMGDAGSAFLGFLLGTLAISSALWDGPKLATWMILLGVFIVDSSYTLTVRLLTGQRWYEAHRLHGYQKLSRRLTTHTGVVMLIMVINLFWLLPLGWLVEREFVDQIVGILLAYTPLALMCYGLKAGRATDQQV